MSRIAPSRELETVHSPVDESAPDSVADHLTSEELSHVCGTLRPKLIRAKGQVVLHAYDIGLSLTRCLRQLAKRRKEEDKKPDIPGFFHAVAFGLQRQGFEVSDKFLRTCCRIAETIGHDEIRQLAAMELISVGHVHLLANVADPERRHALSQRIASERLSTRELMREVKGITGPQRRPVLAGPRKYLETSRPPYNICMAPRNAGKTSLIKVGSAQDSTRPRRLQGCRQANGRWTIAAMLSGR